MKSDKVIDFIYRLKDIYGGYSEMSGGCYKFHLLLKDLYGGQGYYNSDHVITKIGSKYYDVNGLVTNTEGFLSIEDYYGYDFMDKIFNQYLKTKEVYEKKT